MYNAYATQRNDLCHCCTDLHIKMHAVLFSEKTFWFGTLECVWSGDDTGTTGTTILSSVAQSEDTVIPNSKAGHRKRKQAKAKARGAIFSEPRDSADISVHF